jgi:hypothetical protein
VCPKENGKQAECVVCHKKYGETGRMGCATRSMGRQAECGVPQGIRGDEQNVCVTRSIRRQAGSGVPQAAWGDRQKVVGDKEHGENDRMWCATRKIRTGRI